MKMPLFFHVRDGERAVTFCIGVDKTSKMCVGHAVTSEYDQFNKKIGRNIASGRMQTAMDNNIPQPANSCRDPHFAVSHAMPSVVGKAKELLGMKGNVFVKYGIRDHNKFQIIQKQM